MLNKLFAISKSFFVTRLNRQTRELYTSTIILDFAVSMIAIFEPVFIYNFFIDKYPLKQTLELLLLFYLAVYVPYFFAVPWGAKFAKRFSYENSIALSTVFMVLLYFCMFGALRWPLLMALSIPMYVLAKMFYWPAYHANFARFAVHGEQGREITNLSIVLSVVYIVGPLIGGLILNYYGFKVLFIAASLLMIVSNIPMLVTRDGFTSSPFYWGEAMRRLFAKSYRRKFFANWGFGEELIVLTIWPVFIYLTVGDYLNLGILTALATFLTTVITLYIGRASDKARPSIVTRWGTIFYFFSWIFRVLSRSVLGVFSLDTFSRVAKQAIAVPMTADTYHRAQDDNAIMSTIVSFEMSLVIGKIIAIILALVLLQIFAPGWNAIFLMAAGMTLLYLLF